MFKRNREPSAAAEPVVLRPKPQAPMPFGRRVAERVRENVVSFALFTAGAASYAAYMTHGDDTTFLLQKLPELKALQLNREDAEAMARVANTSDAFKVLLMEDAAFVARLVALSADPAADPELRAGLSKALANATRHALGREHGLRANLAALLAPHIANPRMSMVVRKNLCEALVNLCESADGDDDVPASLARRDVALALLAAQRNVYVRRARFERALNRVAAQCIALQSVRPDDEQLFAELAARAAAHAQRRASGVLRATDSLLASGWLLYLHTAAGGAVWGAVQAVRAGESARGVVRQTVRTALVTSLVPIYVVGGLVTAYNYLRRKLETPAQLATFHAGSAMALYPFVHIIPALDRWAPLWIGGHVLGFVSFFGWLYVSDNDLLKADGELMMRDAMAAQRSGAAAAGATGAAAGPAAPS